MPLRCANGHEWEPKPDGGSTFCPVCGESQQTVTSADWPTLPPSSHSPSRLPPRLEAYEVLEEVGQATLGLQHAHDLKRIHRDIKPANLMVSGKVLKVLDMGVARLHQLQSAEETITTLTQHGAVIGTPDFIAPEQLENQHGADIRADLYSLGCTAYFILSGKVPFDGGTLIQKLDRQRWEVPPSVEQLRPEIPA